MVAALSTTAAAGQTATQVDRTVASIAADCGDSVVVVAAALSLTWRAGKAETTRDLRVVTNATVLDRSGLAVMSLSQLEPGLVFTDGPPVSSSIRDLRIRQSGGRETPARVVLRDEALDLALIQPTGTGAQFAALTSTVASPRLLEVVILLQRTGEDFDGRLAASIGNVQLIIERPDTYFLASFRPLGGTAFGSPVIDSQGAFVGVVVMRHPGQPDRVAAVLGAASILAVAKRAR
jgi:hypothetical protein